MHHNYFRGGFFTISRMVKMAKKGAKEMHAFPELLRSTIGPTSIKLNKPLAEKNY